MVDERIGNLMQMKKLTQPKLRDKSFPVPSGTIPVGGTGSRPIAWSSPRQPRTHPTVPSPPATCQNNFRTALSMNYHMLLTIITPQVYKIPRALWNEMQTTARIHMKRAPRHWKLLTSTQYAYHYSQLFTDLFGTHVSKTSKLL